jgi:hypothetical protein
MTRFEVTTLVTHACSAAGLLLLALAVASSAAEAKRYRPTLASPPLKDCTRLNGRWGYYGNPWCSKAEQLRWDRWDAARAARSASGAN